MELSLSYHNLSLNFVSGQFTQQFTSTAEN